ncbi:hypothetical protein BaRGS_00029798 [Batillaria attramentaria]|uniref:Uncharacterized protein n=1 Tax=Batillaria attramentaria TaxID=370345 RepID=A0ABD0JW78_9CAEN
MVTSRVPQRPKQIISLDQTRGQAAGFEADTNSTIKTTKHSTERRNKNINMSEATGAAQITWLYDTQHARLWPNPMQCGGKNRQQELRICSLKHASE